MDINEKVLEVKNRIKELTKSFPYTDYEINMLTICYIAIAAIDNDITDILDYVFGKCCILFNDGRFSKFLNQYYEDSKNAFDFYQEPSFTSDKLALNDFIVISVSPIRPMFDIFEGLLHEIIK